MKRPSLKAVTEVTCLAPQFLVDDLSEAIGYYRDRLGFEPDFVYESFYASVSRDGFSIHHFRPTHHHRRANELIQLRDGAILRWKIS
jgi:catechol 2,3-dioxygenase-like lactoylglutathione lyase family enzyme